MWIHGRAIVWAQWRSLVNSLPRSSKTGLIFSNLMSALWYAGFVLMAVIAGVVLADPGERAFIHRILPTSLLLCFLYWQLIPVFMAAMGSSLDMKKLLVYPVPTSELFALEVVLRISTSVEMVLLNIGAAIGLLWNPTIPFWAPLSLLFFVVFNLLCSAGVRELLTQLLARRKLRELAIFLFVIIAAMPQVILYTGLRQKIGQFVSADPSLFWPWTAVAALAQGNFSWISAAWIVAWTIAAYLFGRSQFERGLRFDAGAAAAEGSTTARRPSRLEWFFQLPNSVFRDPLATLIEKELRVLVRSPRFRLVFLMGFSFGLLIWIPSAFGQHDNRHTLLSSNYLTFVSVYALLLLSDVLFWNCFGFDRSAAQLYFTAPIKMSTVLIGKNITAALFVLLEIVAITIVCALLRLPISVRQILEAAAVMLVLTLFLLSIGNLTSLYNPRFVSPSKSLRTAASARMQALLMLTFPVALLPVALAYLARYAFDSELAFFGVLLISAILGFIFYRVSMETAVKASSERTERIITALSRGAGPIES